MTTQVDIRTKIPVYHRNWLNRVDIINKIEIMANKYAKGTTLDLGCGSRPYETLFRNKAKKYLGIDLQVSYQVDGPDICASALQVPLCDCMADTVVSFQVLEHVPQPQQMFAEISRVLKPDGYLILMAPQMWNLHEKPHDYFRYTRYGLIFMAEHVGLKVVTVHPLSGFWIRAGLVISYKLTQFRENAAGKKSGFYPRIILGLTAINNLIFRYVDQLWSRKDDPINNLLIAQKCR